MMEPTADPIETAWQSYMRWAIEPTAPAEVLAVLKLAFVAGRASGLSDMAEACSVGPRRLTSQGVRLLVECVEAGERQAAKCNALRSKWAAKSASN